MAIVVFEANPFGPDCRVEAADGERLVDLCDRAEAPVPFSCRSATCGTCRIEVWEGEELLEAPNVSEAALLAILGDPPGVRLACQAKLGRGEGVIRLRIAGEPI